MPLIAPIQVDQDPPSSRRTSLGDEKHPSSCITTDSEQQQARSRKHGLISFEELPAWHQDNPFVKHGYRPIERSTTACLRSWGFLHNETLNIYTHLIPAVAALFIGEAWVLLYLRHTYVNVVASDYAVFAFLLFAAATCLGISSAYHTLMSHSREVEARWLRLDFVGIIVLIVGSFVSGIYVGFWCEPTERKIYWSMSVSLGAVSIAIMILPYFQGPRWRTFRLVVFVVTGLSGFAPIIHGIHMFGFTQMAKQSGLPYYLAEGGLFLIGAITYACRFPECIKPGTFDIFGSSHQIFHILVVIATLVHLVGVLQAFDYNYHHRQCSW
ncbi:putative mPR-like GPCR protein [Rosellinia necatrix]|uniref:Putative mPR-like GPCR protein n=1 Tax=Rosellinia necatrix TaxID=77044 RepID=A0A1W2TQU7_ROSNE|nr:putative mPR-like GPCR protein [Rosellinia necatrix]